MNQFLIWLPLILCFVLFFLRCPVYISLIAPEILYFGVINRSMPIGIVFQRAAVACESFPLLAMPLFILVGNIMNGSLSIYG